MLPLSEKEKKNRQLIVKDNLWDINEGPAISILNVVKKEGTACYLETQMLMRGSSKRSKMGDTL